jgi:hypothetical protein
LRSSYFILSYSESVGTETRLDPREKFKVDNFYTILDCLRNELEHRVNAYSEIQMLFSFLTEYDSMKYDDHQLKTTVGIYLLYGGLILWALYLLYRGPYGLKYIM